MSTDLSPLLKIRTSARITKEVAKRSWPKVLKASNLYISTSELLSEGDAVDFAGTALMSVYAGVKLVSKLLHAYDNQAVMSSDFGIYMVQSGDDTVFFIGTVNQILAKLRKLS